MGWVCMLLHRLTRWGKAEATQPSQQSHVCTEQLLQLPEAAAGPSLSKGLVSPLPASPARPHGAPAMRQQTATRPPSSPEHRHLASAKHQAVDAPARRLALNAS